MIKYSFEQKKALVTAYLNGEGGIRTVIKKYGYSNRSQLQRWIVAYQMYGDDGLKISQKTFNYSFEKKLTVVKLYLSSKLSYQEVSLQTGIINPNLISHWVCQYRSGGPDALRPKKKGLQKALEENPELKGAMFIVCDQPGLTAATFARMLDIGKKYPGKIVCAGRKGKMGNPVLWDRCFFDELSRLSGDKGGKQIIGAHMNDVLLCETEETELRDVDIPEQLTKWERDYGKSGKSGEET